MLAASGSLTESYQSAALPLTVLPGSRGHLQESEVPGSVFRVDLDKLDGFTLGEAQHLQPRFLLPSR